MHSRHCVLHKVKGQLAIVQTKLALCNDAWILKLNLSNHYTALQVVAHTKSQSIHCCSLLTKLFMTYSMLFTVLSMLPSAVACQGGVVFLSSLVPSASFSCSPLSFSSTEKYLCAFSLFLLQCRFTRTNNLRSGRAASGANLHHLYEQTR